jgi:hypothetical protein
MGITKRSTKQVYDDYSDFQLGVIEILDEYDYEILDLRYIEEFKQIVITLKGLVLFVTQSDVSISFEINKTPDTAANFILILSEKVSPKNIHVTDSFIITQDVKGKNIAVFGPDAQEIYRRDLAYESYNNGYLRVLMSPNIKFYKC